MKIACSNCGHGTFTSAGRCVSCGMLGGGNLSDPVDPFPEGKVTKPRPAPAYEASGGGAAGNQSEGPSLKGLMVCGEVAARQWKAQGFTGYVVDLFPHKTAIEALEAHYAAALSASREREEGLRGALETIMGIPGIRGNNVSQTDQPRFDAAWEQARALLRGTTGVGG